MAKGIHHRECGCRVIIAGDLVLTSEFKLCPLHEAAGDLRSALVRMLKALQAQHLELLRADRDIRVLDAANREVLCSMEQAAPIVERLGEA